MDIQTEIKLILGNKNVAADKLYQLCHNQGLDTEENHKLVLIAAVVSIGTQEPSAITAVTVARSLESTAAGDCLYYTALAIVTQAQMGKQPDTHLTFVMQALRAAGGMMQQNTISK